MSRTETANSLTVSGVTERIESWSDRIEAARRTEARLTEAQADLAARTEAFDAAKAASVDEMARAMLPLAAAMARLIEETRRTLEEIAQESRETQRRERTSTEAASKEAARVLGDLQATGLKLEARIQGFLEAGREQRQQTPPNAWIPALVSPVLLCGLAILARLVGWL